MITDRTKYNWSKDLKGKISDEILQLQDAKGNYYLDLIDEDLLKYVVKKLVDLPWSNHLVLSMIVGRTRNLSPLTIRTQYNVLSNRLKDIFDWYHLSDMNEFSPDVHLFEYLKGKIYKEHTSSQRAKLQKNYFHVQYQVENWVRNKITPDKIGNFQKYILPKPSFGTKEFNLSKMEIDNAQQIRKLETSAITPLLPQIRAEGHLRRNQLVRLREKYREVLLSARENNWSFPIEFDYRESEAVGEHFYFKLWDKSSFVIHHPEHYAESSLKAARNSKGSYAEDKNEYFVEFMKSERLDDGTEGEGLWFLELIREDVLGHWSQNKSNEELTKRLNFLHQWGYGTLENSESYPVPFYSQHKGVLGQSTFISQAQQKTKKTIFNVEPFHVAATFALFSLSLFTSSGVRINELLQIHHDKACLVVAEDNHHNPPRKNFILRLVPKGRDEPENYYVPEDIFKFIREILQLLREHYSLDNSDPIPSVSYEYEHRKHMFGKNKYLFQYHNRHFDSEVIHSILRFLLHGIVIQTDEGGQVTIKPHLLRHAFATHAVQTEKLPIDIVKELLHQKDVQVTGYYSQPTQGQIGQAVNDLHDNWVSHIDIQQGILRGPEELQEFYDEYSSKVGTLSKVTGGVCTTDSVCPVKMACVGCAAKVPRPEFKEELEDYLKWASESEEFFRKCNQPLEMQKMKLAKIRARNELKEIQLIENYQRDAKYDPVVRIKRP